MIEVVQTITLTNDGSVWTLTPEEARRLHLILGSLVDPGRTSPTVCSTGSSLPPPGIYGKSECINHSRSVS